MSLNVKYETANGPRIATPHDYHAESDPLLTMLWFDSNGAVDRKLQVPLQRVVYVEDR